MASAQRSRTLTVAQQQLWELISDPHHMPRWWPSVDRMEGVDGDRFTQVFKTKGGRPVRADFHIVDSRPPWLLAWEQDVEGTPFARVLRELVIEVRLEPEGDATKVTIAQQQRLRGYSRTGGFMMRRATAKQLDRALEGLEQISR
jgi:uncharacterized protein YndB with AHSA1/START domain